MIPALISSLRVRLGSPTNTQGTPFHRPLYCLRRTQACMDRRRGEIDCRGMPWDPIKHLRPFVGIDRADAKHDICMQGAGSSRREFSCIAHDPAQIESWACSLQERFGGPVAVALELTKGPIVYALQKYDFIVLFPINPATLARYRQAFKPSGAKD